jgi:hypothetical protein
MLAIVLGTPTAALANHTINTDCIAHVWVEGVREDSFADDDGVRAQIWTSWPQPPSDPVVVAMIRSSYIWKDVDNWAEVGWSWWEPLEHEPTAFAAWTDFGTYDDVSRSPGSGGDLNTWHTYHIRNSGTEHWIWQNDGTDFKNRTFVTFNVGNAAGDAEVKNTCDSSYTHQTNLYRKDCNACGWVDWQAINDWSVGDENPCYHTDLTSVHEWYALHGEGSGETCQNP